MAEAIHASSVAKARIVILTGEVAEASPKPEKKTQTAGPASCQKMTISSPELRRSSQWERGGRGEAG